jgi:hypothetical protein
MLSDLRERVWSEFLDFAWRQWAQVGVSANITYLDRWAIDPEALILFTIEIARRDPRLFDEMLDWLAHNRRLLAMQRIWNLGAKFPVDNRLIAATVAWAGESVPARWPRNPRYEEASSGRIPVFSPDVLRFIAEPDPIFEEYDYIRPRVIQSGKSIEPDVKMPANFAFQLRLLFGPGSRSEVIRILLTFTDGPLDAARISTEAGFSKRNVTDTLANLVASRVIKARWSRNERHYLAYRTKWATLLETGPSAEQMPVFVSWVHLFPACLEIISWLDDIANTEDSEYLISSQARDLMERVAPNLEVVGLDVSPKHSVRGAAYLRVFEDAVESVLATVGARRNPDSLLLRGLTSTSAERGPRYLSRS